MSNIFKKIVRKKITIQGQVQGVGFRPFVFVTAEQLGLSGLVRNTSQGVIIEIQGPDNSTKNFCKSVQKKAPPLAKITLLQIETLPIAEHETVFTIEKSLPGQSHSVLISPDMSLCPDCLTDICDHKNRRHAYPFTNCTNCGPRYSITKSIPYDREYTSMACFPMCEKCAAEYHNPHDRRFHAQPNACPQCGPEVWLVESQNLKHNALIKTPAAPENRLTGQAAIEKLATKLHQGKIAAIKGLGGFHLVCDATNSQAVDLLRQRKQRPHKALAVMLQNLYDAEQYVKLNALAKKLLLSQERPAVVCPIHKKIKSALPTSLTPDTHTLAIMLPYTPLHHCILEEYTKICKQAGDSKPPMLVVTSGNIAGNPICLGNRQAICELEALADIFLCHNRDILIRVDDSVILPDPKIGPMFFRRARGYVPSPLPLPQNKHTDAPAQYVSKTAHKGETLATAPARARQADQRVLLGIGADLKNTFCLNKNTEAFVSQHIGDLENLDTMIYHQEMTTHLQSLLKVLPEAVICDLHPNFNSTKYAQSLGLPLFTLQHHFAHAHAVLAENHHQDTALVLTLDGTGLGDDGRLWGGELLLISPRDNAQKRVGTFTPLTLPGGEAAIREPWRIAHALLLEEKIISSHAATWPAQLCPWINDFHPATTLLPQILATRLNCHNTSSAGRVFDAASSILGLCHSITYEGQAAIKLESAQLGFGHLGPLLGNSTQRLLDNLLAIPQESLYPCAALSQNDLHVLDTRSLLCALALDQELPVDAKARLFHASLAHGLLNMVKTTSVQYNVTHIGLSGGCMQNITLLRLLVHGLEQHGLKPLIHKQLPPGDGCISYGQVAWGMYNIPAFR